MELAKSNRNLLTDLNISPHELSKPVRAPLPSDLKISLNTIRTELECPICLGIFKDPFMTSECCHVFCRSCISKLAEQNESFRCPVCSKKIVKDLIPATFMVNLLHKLVPNMPDFRNQEEKLLREHLAKHFHTLGPVLKDVYSRQKPKRPAHNEDDKIEFRLLKDPYNDSLPRLTSCFVRVPQSIKASVLIKLLETQLPNPHPNTLFVLTRNGDRKEIHRSMLLKDMKSYWDLLSPSSWTMYYTIKNAS
jgi:hypothetical protein